MRKGKVKRLLAIVFSVTLLLTYSGMTALAETVEPQEGASAGRDVSVSTWNDLKDAIDEGASITLVKDIYGPGEGGGRGVRRVKKMLAQRGSHL